MLIMTFGALLVALGLPLAMRRVPRNRFYGLRTPSTLRDDRIWYPANRRSGLDLIGLGSLAVVSGLVLSLTGMSTKQQGIVGGAVVGGLLVVAARGFLHGRKLVRELERTG